jgi:hypothetical protein
MKRFSFFTTILLAAGMALLQQGCGLHLVVTNSGPMDPYPNAAHIETRVRIQVNRISTALQAGNLDQDAANGLASNDELVRRFVREDRAQFNQTQDLTGQQTYQLNSMLNDNERSITDAIQNRESWNQYFGGGGNPNQAYSGNSGMNMAYLDYQWSQQQNRVNTEVNSGQLTNDQAQELNQRIQVTRDTKINFYHQNGRMILSDEQINQLNQMTRDNEGYLNYRIKGSQGQWDRSRFNQWRQQNPKGLNSQNGGDNNSGPSNNSGFGTPSGNNNNISPSIGGGSPGPGQANPSSKPQAQNLGAGQNGTGSAMPGPSYQNGGTLQDKHGTPSPGVITQGNGFGQDKHGSTPPAPVANNGSSGPSGNVSTSSVKNNVTIVPGTSPKGASGTGQAFLPKDQLNQFLKQKDQSVQAALRSHRLSKSQVPGLNQKLNGLHQKSDGFIRQNHGQGLTKAQMDQLTKMGAAIDQMIQANMASASDSPDKDKNHPGGGKP